eukprot:7222901-Prymnesium_polylepis.2
MAARGRRGGRACRAMAALRSNVQPASSKSRYPLAPPAPCADNRRSRSIDPVWVEGSILPHATRGDPRAAAGPQPGRDPTPELGPEIDERPPARRAPGRGPSLSSREPPSQNVP